MDDPARGLDALLRAAAPPDLPDHDRVVATAWARVEAGIAAASPVAEELARRRLDLLADRERAARRRRRVARVAGATLAVVVAGAGTAAAAEYLSTRTGQHTTGWEVGAGGSGELLDDGGSDRDQVFAQLTADIPFPATRPAARAYALGFFPRASDSLISESSLRVWVAGNAVCSWADAWIADSDAGDHAAQAADTGSLAASLSWEPFLTFSTDHGEPSPRDAVPGRDFLGWLRPLADAVGRGDRQGVLDAVANSHHCSADVLPAIQHDPAYPLADGAR